MILFLQRTKSHKKELSGSENLVSESTSPTVEKALMLKSLPMKLILCSFHKRMCCFMLPCDRRGRSVEGSRFVRGHDIVNVY